MWVPPRAALGAAELAADGAAVWLGHFPGLSEREDRLCRNGKPATLLGRRAWGAKWKRAKSPSKVGGRKAAVSRSSARTQRRRRRPEARLRAGRGG